MTTEEIKNRVKTQKAMLDAGQIAYELIGSRRKNEEESSKENYYHWRIKLVCAVCKHVQSGELRTGWNGRRDTSFILSTMCCESCDTQLVIEKHTDVLLRDAKRGNSLALGALKHYPR